MRRKYFMRGMGTGIVITSLIFTISFLFKEDRVSNAYIIEEAKKLGMVMPGNETVKSQKEGQEDGKDENVKNKEEGAWEGTEESEPEGKVTVENLEGDEVTEPPKETTDSGIYTNKTKDSEKSPGKGQISFSIRQGESSDIVSANLYKAGLVKNPTEFNTYLETNGYDKFIRVGDYSIKEGSSDREIAKAITGR